MTETDKQILKSLDCIMQFLYVAHPELSDFSIYKTLGRQMAETHHYIHIQEEEEKAKKKATKEFKKNLLMAMKEAGVKKNG